MGDLVLRLIVETVLVILVLLGVLGGRVGVARETVAPGGVHRGRSDVQTLIILTCVKDLVPSAVLDVTGVIEREELVIVRELDKLGWHLLDFVVVV